MAQDSLFVMVSCLPIVCVLTYAITSILSIVSIRSRGTGKQPPKIPYWIPLIGNTIAFSKDVGGFLIGTTKSFGYSVPATISLLGGQKIHLVSNSEFITTVLGFKSSKLLTMRNGSIIAFEYVFGVPARSLPVYYDDDSGIHMVPHPGTMIKPHNRIFHVTHRSSQRYLTGKNLALLARRFNEKFSRLLNQHPTINVSDSWVDVEDFYGFLQHTLFEAQVVSMCGEHIFRLNPTLTEDYWVFDYHTPDLLKRVPRWISPKPYAARDKMLVSLKKWQAFASENYDKSLVNSEDPDEDEYYGTKWLRQRAYDNSKIDRFDADACASEDLGLLFAGNGNTVPAAFWMLYFILTTPGLFAKVREEVEVAFDGTTGIYKLSTLSSSAVLSSLYAETLRLRNAVLVTRQPTTGPFAVGPWLFPKEDLIGMSNYVTSRNPELWNTGTPEDPHPLDTFWPERFLVNPDIIGSGPRKLSPEALVEEKATRELMDATTETKRCKRFSLEGVNGGWIPYGGGPTMCPGRHFAKQEILGAVAVLLGRYEIKLLENQDAEPDTKYMLLGVLPPKNKVSVRIKRRV